jgi:putative ABC transport system substrate-binding protein
MKAQVAYHTTTEEIDFEVQRLAKLRNGGLFVGPVSDAAEAHAAERALKARVPTLTHNDGYRDSPRKHLLLAYVPEFTERTRRYATLVSKVLKGERPGSIPFEQPERARLIINRRIAKALGLEIPSGLELRATEMID